MMTNNVLTVRVLNSSTFIAQILIFTSRNDVLLVTVGILLGSPKISDSTLPYVCATTLKLRALHIIPTTPSTSFTTLSKSMQVGLGRESIVFYRMSHVNRYHMNRCTVIRQPIPRKRVVYEGGVETASKCKYRYIL